MEVRKVIIMGAAGRDFHNFNMLYRDNPKYKVVCFTAAQIPGINGRKYPKELAGELYPKGIPIYSEDELPQLINEYDVDEVVLSYSDLSHQNVMEKASLVLSSGADFVLIAPEKTMLTPSKKVIAVCAVRTGAGKSPTTRYIVRMLRKAGKNPVVVRHPMPYGNLNKMVVQRFASLNDIYKANCTIEEREEYEPLINLGVVVYAGVDYEKILRMAEKEKGCDVIIWDGGNNDTPFFKPDVHIVIADALRPGHEISYYPGFVNLLMADIIIVNKVKRRDSRFVKSIMENIKKYNPKAKVILSRLNVRPKFIDKNRMEDKNMKDDVIGMKDVIGKRAVVIEDGPTLTHGGMRYGAGYVLANQMGVKIINVRRYIVGDLKKTFKKYKHLDGSVLPAMGYSKKEINDLKKTIINSKPDIIISGTPINLKHVIHDSVVDKIPIIRAFYELEIVSNSHILSHYLCSL